MKFACGIELSPGTYIDPDWEPTDSIIDLAEKEGIEPIDYLSELFKGNKKYVEQFKKQVRKIEIPEGEDVENIE